MKFNRIESKTLREIIYDQLRNSIICGDILPGQSISLNDLAKQFDVSIMPVREAIFLLKSEKVIAIESSKSIRVNTLTAIEMQEALRIRTTIEPLAAERACELRPDNALPKVERLLEDLQTSLGNSKKYIAKNSQFHFAIYSYAQSPLLLQMLDWLWARVSPYFYIHLTDEKFLAQTFDVHREMFEAFCNKDKEKIKDALQRDLKNAAHHIIPLLGIPTHARTS